MNLEQQRAEASRLSLGSSSNDILDSIFKIFKQLNISKSSNIIDIGCGQGELLSKIASEDYLNLTGCDYTLFKENHFFNFFQQDCNLPFPDNGNLYDTIVCSEVIEHIENPWLFIRNIKGIAKPGTHLILSTPNPESWLSIMTFIFKGYFNAFGPKDYPAHITPLSAYELKNALEKVGAKEIQFTFINNGRIPGTSKKWCNFFPFLRGKRFSDNYIVHAVLK